MRDDHLRMRLVHDLKWNGFIVTVTIGYRKPYPNLSQKAFDTSDFGVGVMGNRGVVKAFSEKDFRESGEYKKLIESYKVI